MVVPGRPIGHPSTPSVTLLAVGAVITVVLSPSLVCPPMG